MPTRPRFHTYRVVTLGVFLHCTLGGFADEKPNESDLIIARMYKGKRTVADIMEAAHIGSSRTLYKRIRKLGLEFRRPVNAQEKQTVVQSA